MLLASTGTILVDRVQKKILRTLIHDTDSNLVPQASLISFPVLASPFKFLHFAFCQVIIHLFLYCHMISPLLIVLLPQSSRPLLFRLHQSHFVLPPFLHPFNFIALPSYLPCLYLLFSLLLPLFYSIFAPPAPTHPFWPSIKSSDCSLTDLRVRTVQYRYL